jgi:hypothetical protein
MNIIGAATLNTDNAMVYVCDPLGGATVKFMSD